VLAGQTVLLTGAAGGLGRVFAHALAATGANLVLTGRRPEPLAELAEELATEPLVVAADLTDPASAVILAEAGAVDVLINNAGTGGPHGPLWTAEADDWWRTVEVNLRCTLTACQAVLPAMVDRGAGRIINIVSAAGRYRWPYASAYSVSKAAIIKLTENLVAELRSSGVTVFSLHPGLLDLGLTHRHLAAGPTGDLWTDQVGEWFREQREKGLFTPPEQAAELLLDLAGGAMDDRSGEYIAPEVGRDE
jgi:short-subunit dehydrogenase